MSHCAKAWKENFGLGQNMARFCWTKPSIWKSSINTRPFRGTSIVTRCGLGPESTRVTRVNTIVVTDQDVASKESISRKWQFRWDHSDRGRHMHALRSKVSLAHSKTVYPSQSVYTKIAQLRTGYCRLNQYQHKIGVVQSPDCSCGNGSETIEHYLLQCQDHQQARDLMDYNLFCDTGLPCLSIEALLSEGVDVPFKEHRSTIARHLGHFIETTGRLYPAKSSSTISSHN